MESKDASAQLREADRLRSATVHESTWAPRWLPAAFATGTVAYFTVYGLVGDSARLALSWIWTAFVVSVIFVVRRRRRAQPAREVTKRDAVEWAIEALVALTIVLLVGRISWMLVGLLLALLGVFGGASAALRNRRR